MVSTDKTQWPTPERIAELRKVGAFAYSRYATKACMLAGFLIAVYAMKRSWAELVQSISKLIQAEELTLKLANDLFSILSHIVFVVSGTMIAFGVIAVIAQSKFFFSFINLTINLGRIIPFRGLSFSSFLFAILSGIFGISMAVLIGGCIVWFACRQVFYILVYGQEKFLLWPQQFMDNAVPLLLVALLVSSLIAFFFARIAFMYKHRMSSREAQGGEVAVDRVFL